MLVNRDVSREMINERKEVNEENKIINSTINTFKFLKSKKKAEETF